MQWGGGGPASKQEGAEGASPQEAPLLPRQAPPLTSCVIYLGVITDLPLSSCSTSIKLTRKSSSASAEVREGATI